MSVQAIGTAALAGFAAYKLMAKGPDDISGRVVLITGAGGGVGQLAALAFAAQGCDVVVWDLSEEGMQRTVKLVQAKYPQRKVWTKRVDVTDREVVYAAAAEMNALVAPRHVSILVNNAGIMQGLPLLKSDDAKIVATFKVNTLSHFWTCKAFLPEMISRKQGHVVTVASIAGLTAAPLMVDYAASKFGAVGFTEGLRRELQDMGVEGVHTSTVCPAHIATDLFKGFKQPILGSLEPSFVADVIVDVVRRKTKMVVKPDAFDPSRLKSFVSTDMEDWLSRATGAGSSSMMEGVDRSHADKRLAMMSSKL
eukprot:Hpha_TRINITY_DN10688_c0_g1::TRINITY_DN10688_c0_g1_i1::g.156793::m.156793/K15734/SDR16C5; all-trans-retinol dehydrogenase (NAD+)